MPLLKYVYDTYETTQNKIRIIRMDELWNEVCDVAELSSFKFDSKFEADTD